MRIRNCSLLLTLLLVGCGGVSVNLTGASSPSVPSAAPVAPTDIKAAAGDTQVALSWSASVNATSYALERGETSGGPYTHIGTSPSASYTDAGLTNGTPYYYVVIAVSGAGQSASSAEVAATPNATMGVPPIPLTVVATAGDAQVGLTWTASTGAISYRVKRANIAGGPYSVIAAPTSAFYADMGLANGTTYYYVVSALGSAGESSNSIEARATPAASATASSPPAICPTPFTADTRETTVTVGSGTAASCTETALANALAKGGVIRFSCGGPATITLTSQKTLRTDVDTTLDGQGMITLDGRGTTRLLYYFSPNFQATKTTITIQNMTLQNGAASGTAIPVAPAPCSQGTKLDGGGGAIYVRDGMLRVWNTIFKNNTGAAEGPDVAGGAIYTLGSLGTTIVGSTFQSNHAANGGAVGSLFGDLSIYNSRFASNRATGSGANYIDSSCHVSGGESGNGGNGGAVVIDGSENYAVTVCGSTFTSNAGGTGALGGAIFRTPDGAIQTTTIDRSALTGNSAPKGGALYFHNSNLVIKASTLDGNTAASGGALFADGTTLDFSNDTFVDNVAQKGLGGAIYLSGNGGSLQNVTFAGNQSSGGSGYFAAAIGGGTALTITNTLFAENTTKDCGSPMACSAGASQGSNDLQWPATHAVCANADIACTPGAAFKNPQLAVLGGNGGPTPTAAPLPGSPAVGIGQNCPATDQRGIARPSTGCTAGAVEGAVSP
jgi:hypothetical protein